MQLAYFKYILEQIKHIKKCGIGVIRISFIKYIACLIGSYWSKIYKLLE